MQNKYR